MAGSGYTYPNSDVLKNREGITDDVAFESRLGELTALRHIQIRRMELPQEFDSHYLKEIHRHIFQDAFEWAGHTRDVPFTFSDGTTASMPTLRKEGAKVAFASGSQIQKGFQLLGFLCLILTSSFSSKLVLISSSQRQIGGAGVSLRAAIASSCLAPDRFHNFFVERYDC